MSGSSQVATPSMPRVRLLLLEEQAPSSPSISVYSNLSCDPEENQLTYEEALNQILTLTNELKEFEKSSKELEDAMELELDELNREKDDLLLKLGNKDDELRQQKLKMIQMEKELNSLMNKNNDLLIRLETELNLNNQKLIKVEIQNDYFENNERIIGSKLRTLEENYNDAIEKNVILQGEIGELSELYNKEKLSNSNKDNIITDLNLRISRLELDNERLKVIIAKPDKLSRFKTPLLSKDFNSDMTVTPPPLPFQVPRSSSMKQIQQMSQKTNQLSQQADTLRQRIEDMSQQEDKKKTRLSKFRSKSDAIPLSHNKENENPSRIVSESATNRTRRTKLLSDSSNVPLEIPKETSQKKGSRFFMAFKKTVG